MVLTIPINACHYSS